MWGTILLKIILGIAILVLSLFSYKRIKNCFNFPYPVITIIGFSVIQLLGLYVLIFTENVYYILIIAMCETFIILLPDVAFTILTLLTLVMIPISIFFLLYCAYRSSEYLYINGTNFSMLTGYEIIGFVFVGLAMLALILLILTALIMFFCCEVYVKAPPPDTMYIIRSFTGVDKKIVGKSTLRNPFFQKINELLLTFSCDELWLDELYIADLIDGCRDVGLDMCINFKARVSQDMIETCNDIQMKGIDIAKRRLLNYTNEKLIKEISSRYGLLTMSAKALLEENIKSIPNIKDKPFPQKFNALFSQYGAETMDDNLKIFSQKLRERIEETLRAEYGLEIVTLDVIKYIETDTPRIWVWI